MKKETRTSVLTVTPRKEQPVELFSKEQLAEMTKYAILELALEKLGVELDMRDSKSTLIETFLTYQGNND